MLLHCMKPMHLRMRQSSSLRPEITRNPVRSYRDLREDALEELASAVALPTLNFKYKWDKLLLRVLHEEAVLVPLVLCFHN